MGHVKCNAVGVLGALLLFTSDQIRCLEMGIELRRGVFSSFGVGEWVNKTVYSLFLYLFVKH